jgi:hypothetical protein
MANPFVSTLQTAYSMLFRVLPGGSRGTISEYVPNAPASYGQPRQGSGGDVYGQITPARMREIVLKAPTVAGAMNAILDYCSGVKVKVRNADPSKNAPVRAARFVNDLLERPNPQDDEREFRRKLLRDLAILGYAAIEIEPGATTKVANLHVLDGANVRIDYDSHGTVLGYDQLDPWGKPILGTDGIHTFTPDEVVFFQLDPRSESRYPGSRVAQLFAAGVIEQMMLAFIGGRFSDSNIPFGVMDLGDISEDEIVAAIALWNNQVENQSNHEQNIIMTGSKGGANWIPFNYKLSELEAPKLLASVRMYILSILGVTVNEMGDADQISKANGFNLSYTFKKRAIEPILDVFVTKFSAQLLRHVLGFLDLELYYEEIDSRDELLQAQIDKVYLDEGAISINQVRNRKGLPSIDGGDEPHVNTGASRIPVSMIDNFAQVQLDALNLAVLSAQVSIQQILQQMATPTVNADGSTSPPPEPITSLPLLRMMQPPERFTTPDASGSSSFKEKLPAAGPKPMPASAKAPTAPRGPVEAAQRAGARKDQMQHDH